MRFSSIKAHTSRQNSRTRLEIHLLVQQQVQVPMLHEFNNEKDKVTVTDVVTLLP